MSSLMRGNRGRHQYPKLLVCAEQSDRKAPGCRAQRCPSIRSEFLSVLTVGFVVLGTCNVFDAYVVKRSYTSDNADDGDWPLLMLRMSTDAKGKKSASYVPTFRKTTDADDDAYEDRTRDILLQRSMLRVTYTSSSAMHWITEVLRADGATAPTTASVLRDVLRSGARTAVRNAYFDKPQRPTGFSIERVVFTYLDYLLLRGAAAGELSSTHQSEFSFMFRSSIEHFHPQYRDVEQEATAVIRKNREFLESLALITVSGNSKYSNNSPGTMVKPW